MSSSSCLPGAQKIISGNVLDLAGAHGLDAEEIVRGARTWLISLTARDFGLNKPYRGSLSKAA